MVEAAGLPAGAVVVVAILGYVLKMVYQTAKALSINPNLSTHLDEMQATLRAILAHQQDGLQHLSRMDANLDEMAKDVAILKDRGR